MDKNDAMTLVGPRPGGQERTGGMGTPPAAARESA